MYLFSNARKQKGKRRPEWQRQMRNTEAYLRHVHIMWEVLKADKETKVEKKQEGAMKVGKD